MRIGVYSIETIDSVSEIERYLKPYCSLMNYRQLFMSKEWIKSYCIVYKPNKMVFVYNTYTQDYILFEKQGSTLCCLGDPLNDFNLCNIREAHELEEWLHIIEQIKAIDRTTITLNCVTTRLSNGSIDALTMGMMIDLIASQNRKISSKYKRMQKKYCDTIQYNRITPNNPIFTQVLDHLLIGRRMVLSAKAPDNNRYSLDERFTAFIQLLCSQHSLHDFVYIDYGIVGDSIVSIVLFFQNNNDALYYLRWCLRSSNKISYGPLLDLWSINQDFLKGYHIIDFSRGNDSYKYRLGFNEYKLYNYVI